MKSSLIKASVITCLAAGLVYGPATFDPDPGTVFAAAGETNVNENPTVQTINRMLTEAAVTADIPPEVVKAVAMKESGWRQFVDGVPYQSADNGYGIMQITNFANYQGKEELIKYDIEENIKAGVEILNSMYDRNDLPKVKDADRHDIESWYFPVMAYNGIKPVNSPLKSATGVRNDGAYQEQVFTLIEEENFLSALELRSFEFSTNDFRYDPASDRNIEFLKDEYEVANLHESAYFFQTGEQVVTSGNTNLRKTASTSQQVKSLAKNTALEITGPFRYDENPESNNTFVWYPVKTADNQYSGFVSSAYLKKASENTTPSPADNFKDVEKRYQPAIEYLVSKGIKGTSADTFGTYDFIKRVDAAVILAEVIGMDIENAPASGFTDVPGRAVKHVNALKAAGITNGKSATSFGAQDLITRGELAVWIEQAFKLQVDAENAVLPFDDVAKQYAQSVAALVSNGVTNGTSATTFGTYDNAKRGDYAIFMYRAAGKQ
nr:S-layer homology domain-containing protein [uncultured Bacillus sp.]